SLGPATPELKKPAINRGIPNALSTALAPRRRSPQSKSPNPSARADTGHIGGESAPVRRLLPVFPDPIPPPPPAAAPNRIADSRLLIFFLCAFFDPGIVAIGSARVRFHLSGADLRPIGGRRRRLGNNLLRAPPGTG